MEKKFNPEAAPTGLRPCKPGDKIICVNGEEFTCCTRDFLSGKKLTGDWHYKFYAYRDNPTNEYLGIDWIGLDSDGKVNGDKGFNILEVIPKQQEETTPNETEVKVEQPTYTAEDIRKAFIHDLEWSDASLTKLVNSLKKVITPEYKEYLRLKAMFENESK